MANQNPEDKSLLRRKPKQDRSRERVDEILSVAMRLIAEKGIDAVTMKEVAQLSGGPIASVYQYFPNKSAILATLYERYNGTAGEMVLDCVEELATVHHLHETIDRLIYRYHGMMKANPELIDLVNAVHADKNLREEDLQQTDRLVTGFYNASRHIFQEDVWPQYRRTVFLLFQLASATVRISLAMPEQDGLLLVKEYAGIVHLQIDKLASL